MGKILIVDDSETQRSMIRKTLEEAGHQIIEARDGADGIEKLEGNADTSVIISDVTMPVMDGLTMCKKIQELGKYQGLPIFMLTTEASSEWKEKAKKLGVRAWIIKPFVPSKLVDAVNKVTKKT